MAHKKAAGSAKNLRDSNPKYRGIKLFGGQFARAGNIVIRQKGDKYLPGLNAYKAKDFTIHAGIDGVVSFRKKQIVRYDGRKYLKTVIDIVPVGQEIEKIETKKPVAKKATKKVESKKTEKKVEDKIEPKTIPIKETKKVKTTDPADDLTKIKGLGPKAAEALIDGGISSYKELADAGVDGIKAILESVGGRLASTDPSSRIEEAKGLL